MKRTTFILLFLITIIFNSCNSCKQRDLAGNNKETKGYISISGAFALYPITVRWAEEFHKEFPGIKIDISAGGAGKGMTDALSQMVDLGMFSREVREEEIEKGAWYIALTKDAVLPTINASNPFLKKVLRRGITKEELKKIYVTGEIKRWDELLIDVSSHQRINVYTRSDACGATAMWGKFLGTTQEGLFGLGVFGDPGVADAVKNDKFSFGYNNVVYIYDINTRRKYYKLEVIPIDFNNNGVIDNKEDFYSHLDSVMHAIKEGIYPSPPARDLYFVSKGKPQNKAVLEFIKWILTNGQQYVKEAGYVQLSDERIHKELKKLDN